jgi:SAM-dependent methyltransferase
MEPGAYAEFRDLEDHHWWFRARKRLFTALLDRALPRTDDRERLIVDLGCGMGGMLEPLAKHGRVIGMDIEHEALRFCRERGHESVCVGRGEHLPFAADQLDLITAFDTIEHIADDVTVLRECRRVLRPGGRIFVSVPAWQWLYTHQDRLVHHERRYTSTLLAERFRSAGLRTIRVSYINFFLFPVIVPVLLWTKYRQWRNPPAEDDYSSNVSHTPAAPVNRLLEETFAFERHLLRHVSLPFGHSLIGIAEKASSPGGA